MQLQQQQRDQGGAVAAAARSAAARSTVQQWRHEGCYMLWLVGPQLPEWVLAAMKMIMYIQGKRPFQSTLQ
jgi:hypothetical protein